MVFETIASAVGLPGRRPQSYRISIASRLVTTPTRAPRVVIAEDEALIRLDLAEMLAEEGYDVVGLAEDGEKAIALVEDLRPDLVILDIKMPRLDGLAAAEQVARKRIAPVVILTAFSQRDLVERARDAGAMAYLVKPFTKSDLVPAIEMAVSRFAEVRQLETEVRTWGSSWPRARRWTGPRGSSRSSCGSPNPSRSVGSRRRPWTCGFRCARSPRVWFAMAPMWPPQRPATGSHLAPESGPARLCTQVTDRHTFRTRRA